MDKRIEKKKWPPKKIATVAAASGFIIFIAYMLLFSDQRSKLNVEMERITVSTVDYGPFQEYIQIIGTVQPIETFFLDVSQGGTVVTKFVEEGAFLKKGDPIIHLENAQLTLDIMYNEGQLFQQINNLRSTRLNMQQTQLTNESTLLNLEFQLLDLKRTYDNNTELYNKNLISKIEFERSRDRYRYMEKTRNLTTKKMQQDSLFMASQIEQLEKGVERMQANLDIAQQQIQKLTVRAPIDGQLTALNVEIGEAISRGENIGQIDNINSYKVRAEIDEFYIPRIFAGQTGTVPIAGQDYTLEIKKVFPQVSNGRFEVDMLFTGTTPGNIRRGQSMHIRLSLSELSNALLLDRGGFYQKTGGQWVFVVSPNGDFAEKRNIRLGRQNTQQFEVLEGLNEGERVITSSYDNYGDVEKLILKED